ncbi:group 1 truncated hemoglobin [Paralimibaculum aggregatum]|uniref:Group 1 truncated hemoglobin n=1 Tax=Paralimibaculum aggregatum TaxID=3036245 RepID=A0ABQ6LF60_9RHOB|nr:group 1 truncated hemoglobin [Limibaculum sp. NKW23]GMG81975.1 group 1 truncated hemoglobin [Limibaculum sp. NKW23]
MNQKTLYEKYGGFAQINRIVMAFYDGLLDSDEVGPYFDDVDMKRLIDHQTKFVAALMGGPAEFGDDHLRRAHASLGITDAHFDEMKAILGGTLADHGVAAEDVATVLAAIESRRGLVVA